MSSAADVTTPTLQSSADDFKSPALRRTISLVQATKLSSDAQAETAHTRGTVVNMVKEADLFGLQALAREKGVSGESFFMAERDPVGATALHLCYLFHGEKHYEIADWLMAKYP